MTEELRHGFQHMLYELETSSLEVVLVPAPAPSYPGHMIRTVQQSNPEWYKALCDKFQSNRNSRKGKYKKHGDTKIKRKHIIYLLKKLSQGIMIKSKYTDELCYIADEINQNILAEVGDYF